MQFLKDAPTLSLPPNVATIGFFDGVHLGHRNLIQQIRNRAASEQLATLLVTFNNHPRSILQPDWQPQLLTSPDEKLHLLATTGADYCFPLLFTRQLSHLSAREFMHDYLSHKLHVKVLVVGYDHHFGRSTAKTADEGFEQYSLYGRELGMEVVRAGEFFVQGQHVSSSVIRACLQAGHVDRAAQLLGRHYALSGKVVPGQQIGHVLGFPTANLAPDTISQMLPKDGSYAVRVLCDGTAYPGMLYMGTRPTFKSAGQRSVEVNLLHFSGNLYGRQIRIEFIRPLRGESRFSSPDELKAQLQKDQLEVEQIYQQTFP